MLSLRQIAADCLGATGDISVNRDIYGYRVRDGSSRLFGPLGTDDTLPSSGTSRTRSLAEHLDQITGQSIDVTIFMVGLDPDDASKSAVDADDYTKVQYAMQVCRDVYGQADLGIRNLYWRYITPDRAGGYIDISGPAEATDLTEDFSGPVADSLDVFFVRSIAGAAGWSNLTGPCDKSAKDELTGSVCELNQDRRFTGVLIAHEMGHYLGLGSGPGINNMMGSDIDGDGIDTIGIQSTNITTAQAATMRSHCSVRSAC